MVIILCVCFFCHRVLHASTHTDELHRVEIEREGGGEREEKEKGRQDVSEKTFESHSKPKSDYITQVIWQQMLSLSAKKCRF